ncbi:hypothetical protein DPMN_122402 [Dreissena polymorpha]|uniref:DUF6729 domain-containing protein n=1 Tax=Dreissena polymorpha TaxID=45954 RepID=A0A9D4JRY8_DREPO|nr:hypothetical protein DPMN_122402 [Dreissena polymorpha]
MATYVKDRASPIELAKFSNRHTSLIIIDKGKGSLVPVLFQIIERFGQEPDTKLPASSNGTQRQDQEGILEPKPDHPSVSDLQQPTSSVDDIPLTKKWKKTLPAIDQGWISKTFFVYGARGPQFDFDRVKKLWYNPPQPSLSRGPKYYPYHI